MTWVEILMLAIGAALTSLGFAAGKAPKRRECGAPSALAPHSAISRSHRQIHSVGNEDAERVSYRLIHMNGAAAGLIGPGGGAGGRGGRGGGGLGLGGLVMAGRP
jgi:hypothetical protein